MFCKFENVLYKNNQEIKKNDCILVHLFGPSNRRSINKSTVISYDCFVCCMMVKTKITPRKAPANKPKETEKPFSCGTKKFYTGSSDSKIVSPNTSSKSVVSPSTILKSVVSPSFSSPKELDYEDLSDPEIELLDAKSGESVKSSPEVVKADLNGGKGKEVLVQEESIEMQIEEKVPYQNNNTSDPMKGTDSRKVEAIYPARTYYKPLD